MQILYGVTTLFHRYATVTVDCELDLTHMGNGQATARWEQKGNIVRLWTNAPVATYSRRVFQQRQIYERKAWNIPRKTHAPIACTLAGSLYHQPIIPRSVQVHIETDLKENRWWDYVGKPPNVQIIVIYNNQWVEGDNRTETFQGLDWYQKYPESTPTNACIAHARRNNCARSAVGVKVKMWFLQSRFDPHENQKVIPKAPVRFYKNTAPSRQKRQLFEGAIIVFALILAGSEAGGFVGMSNEFSGKMSKMQEENNKRFAKIEQRLNDHPHEVQRLSRNLRGLNEAQNQLMRQAILGNDLEQWFPKWG